LQTCSHLVKGPQEAAQDYHQRYFERDAGQPYCRVVIAPKIARLRAGYLKEAKNT
jgi:peptide-methionine (S)-S-oxide reductase